MHIEVNHSHTHTHRVYCICMFQFLNHIFALSFLRIVFTQVQRELIDVLPCVKNSETHKLHSHVDYCLFWMCIF